MEKLKQAKLDRIAGVLKPDFRHRRRDKHFECLDDAARRNFGIVETENVSENPYHLPALQLFARHPRGLVLDIGAGKRHEYLPNVVNLEVVAYESTDVLAVGEELPFQDAVFDAVHSNAVLEHVKDPFACAREMMRVLRPGGELMCSVPFLQPYHGYPRHYYNMTHQGIFNLFPGMDVFGVEVYEELRPVTALHWIVASWAAGLPADARDRFLGMTLGELLDRGYDALKRESWVARLGPAKNHELACASTLFGRKPGDRTRLACTRAVFGTEAAWTDVTAIVEKLMRGNFLFISCDMELSRFFGDPAPGVAKQLKVAWERPPDAGEIVVEENLGRLVTPLWL